MTKAFSEAYEVLLGRDQRQDTVSWISFTNYTNSKVNIYSVLWCDLKALYCFYALNKSWTDAEGSRDFI